MPAKKKIEKGLTDAKTVKENKVEKVEQKEVDDFIQPEETKERKDYLTRMRENPWILASYVLGILLVGSLVFGSVGGVTGNVISEDDVGTKVTEFLNSQVDGGVVELESVMKNSGFYVVNVLYNGDSVPLLASLDGKYLFTDAVPLDGSGSPTGEGLGSSGRIEIDFGDAPFIGDENAPVTIVEFSDYECPFCAKFYSESLHLIKKNYVDTGKVKLVFMDYPLAFHPNAQKAAEAARCFAAGGGDYFEYHDLLFEKQSSGFSIDKFKEWAVDLGVDGTGFDICLDSGTYAADVLEDMNYGSSLGVSGTPGFFVNGIEISGAQPYSVFEQIIESELKG